MSAISRSLRAWLVAILAAACSWAPPCSAQVGCSRINWDSTTDGIDFQIDCGRSHGVRVGMTGTLFPKGVRDRPIARFVVDLEPDALTAWVSVHGDQHVDPFASMDVVFDQALQLQARGFALTSVDAAARTGVVSAGCREGVRKGQTGQLVRTDIDGSLLATTVVASIQVVDVRLDDCLVTWTPQGAGQVPHPGQTQAVLIGLDATSALGVGALASGDGGPGSRIRVELEGAAIGEKLALLHQVPEGGDVQFGEAQVVSVNGRVVEAVVGDPLLGEHRFSTGDSAVSQDLPACEGLVPRHWRSDEYLTMRVETARSTDPAASETMAKLAEEMRAQSEELRQIRAELARATAPPPPAPVPEPVPVEPEPPPEASSVLHVVEPADGATVDEDSLFAWTADAHCAHRDLAIRIEAPTEGGKVRMTQEQIGQGRAQSLKLTRILYRLRPRLEKGDVVTGFTWQVTNMQVPKQKENCITERRSVRLAQPLRK